MPSWGRRCVLLATALGVALAALVAKNFVLCDHALVVVSEAPGWERWRSLPDLGPFTLSFRSAPCIGHGVQCGLSETELRDPQVCPRCGVSLDAWYGPRGIYGARRDIVLREHEGTYAVVARGSDSAPAKLVVAFERGETFLRPSLARHPTEACFLVVALGVLAVGALVARRDERRGRDLSDPTRFRPATVDGGRVVLDDDAATFVLSDVTLPPGRVLVRQRPPTATDYRTTRTLAARDVVPLDPAIVRELAASHAADARRRAFVIAFVCATFAGVEAAGAWMDESHVLDLDGAPGAVRGFDGRATNVEATAERRRRRFDAPPEDTAVSAEDRGSSPPWSRRGGGCAPRRP